MLSACDPPASSNRACHRPPTSHRRARTGFTRSSTRRRAFSKSRPRAYSMRVAACERPKSHSTRLGVTGERKRAREHGSGPLALPSEINLMSKVFSVAAMALLVFVALGPATWQPRSGLGYELDHFVGYFVFTLMFCLAWPRPLAVGGALVVFALVLENLQSFLPDRSSYFVAALYSAAGVLAAALLAELFIRGRRRSESKGAEGDSTQNA